MPAKDIEVKRATSRRHYARHREDVIKKVADRKRTQYAGVCNNCGGPTVGSSKNRIPEWCGRPECKSAQRKGDPRFVESGKLARRIQKAQKKIIMKNKKKEVTLDELLEEMAKKKRRIG